MAAQQLTDIVRSVTESNGRVGDGHRGRTPDETVTFEAIAPMAPAAKHYVRFGEFWVELCGRCGGRGNVGYGPFAGICFSCNGTGATLATRCARPELDERLTRWARRAVAASRRAEKAAVAAEAERQAWRTENAELVAWAQSLTPSSVEQADTYVQWGDTRAEVENTQQHSDRVVEVREVDGRWWSLVSVDYAEFDQLGRTAANHVRTVRNQGRLDGRETAYLTKVMQEQPGREAERAAVAAASRHAADPKTRMSITGRVVFIKELDNEFGASRMIIVEGTGADEGLTWKTFSAAATVWSLSQGDIVAVKATVHKHEIRNGIKADVVKRPVFTVPAAEAAPAAARPVEEKVAAPAPAPQAAPSVAVAAPPAPSGTRRREALGESAVAGWELLYDKPRAKAQVVRSAEGYGLACTVHGNVTRLDRLTDERDLRKAGGWCCH